MDNFVKFLKDAGYEPHSYSGRGMRGKECFAITVTNIHKAVFNLGYRLGCLTEDVEKITDCLDGFKTDNMGLEYVIYFPDVTYLDDEFLEGEMVSYDD